MIDLGWTFETAPHFVLDVTGDCNITCRACYKRKTGQPKPLAQVFDEVGIALSKRRAQTVSVAGAEPTLHPHLCEIVSFLHQRGLKTALITNGLLLDDTYLARLKKAGLDLVMFHVDEGQRRPDLSVVPTESDVSSLRVRLTQRAAGQGLDTGLSVTLYPDTLRNLPDLVRLVVCSEHIHFLFITNFVDVRAFVERSGVGQATGSTTNTDVVQRLRDALGLEPFASLGGGSWISYFVPVLYGDGAPRMLHLRSGIADSLLVHLPRLLTGRAMFYCQSRPLAVGIQVVANHLAHWQLRGWGDLLCAVFRRGARLDAKRIVCDNGPVAGPNGRVDCFAFCPNATVKNAELVPVCVSDYGIRA